MGLISAKTAFVAYIVLAGLAIVTLNGDMRKYSLVALALFAVKTYVDILRRSMAQREADEALASDSVKPVIDAGPPGGDR